jgi:hypothetical protein
MLGVRRQSTPQLYSNYGEYMFGFFKKKIVERPRPLQKMIALKIEFLGEQDGAPEQELKKALAAFLRTTGNVTRAYLAQVKYSQGNRSPTTNIALCIKTVSGKEDRSIIKEIGEIFARIFGSHCHLDILFISDRQNQEISVVCRPFLDNPPHVRN